MNRAVRIHAYGGQELVQVDQVDVPAPGAGEVLVRVRAAGVNALDWKIRQGYLQAVFPLALPAALGIELAGEVIALGDGVTGFAPGDRVMGALGRLGAYADAVAIDAHRLALVPQGLDDVQAAALPVAGLTAWQALRAAGPLLPGRQVLIHGASGAVGGFAVQFAKAAGAVVLATASAASRAHVLALGADRVFDRHAERFEEQVGDVALVLDLVGGDALDRSWQVLAADGAIVSTAAPDIGARVPGGRRGLWFTMVPDRRQLGEIAGMVAAGTVRSTIARVTGIDGLAQAIEQTHTGHAPGKVVVDFSR
ncbi:NADP-dependent oxidoreductase [Massilia atriviolacea]|uniref:NADP-dependent oxidoreductase n=1 Tax=Massilia atriviolacea TaxID=2495579 RepID=A0A430HRB4_9BURK|nr:NADP-dependent oxidoreductase [Massilia atriviolacea]RSZ60058.1 NADP-dependent oxidoreductase [Massilia atriviolacea]